MSKIEFVEILSKIVRANKVDFSTIKIKLKKVSRKAVDISKREITSKKVRGSKVDFSTIEVTSKKVLGNNVDFSTIEIASKKALGNDLDFSISEIISKKFVEMTWKFAQIWSSTYRHNSYVELTRISRGVPVGLFFCSKRCQIKFNTLFDYENRQQKRITKYRN